MEGWVLTCVAAVADAEGVDVVVAAASADVVVDVVVVAAADVVVVDVAVVVVSCLYPVLSISSRLFSYPCQLVRTS